MTISAVLAVIFIVITIVVASLVSYRVELTRAKGGKIIAFVALFLLPVLASWGGFEEHVQRAESTRFCLSCHVMADYGRSLHVDDPSYIPARHFQNREIPRDHACYTCHTDYTMFGPVRSKLRGLRHIYVQYLGKVPAPEDIKLYQHYNNRECLHCHRGARSYEEASEHHKWPNLLEQADKGELSCMKARCHDVVHDVDTLKDATFWKGGE